MRKISEELIWQIICIVTCILFIPIILVNLTLSIQGSINDNQLPSIFGYSPTVIVSGSMTPELEVNDLIFIKKIDTNNLNAQDIICFIDNNGDFITHRIERIENVNGVVRFYTKGDANNSEDNHYVLTEQIQGKYVGKIAKFGSVVMFFQSPYGVMLTIILLVLLYITGELLLEYLEKKKENVKLHDENQKLKEIIEEYDGKNSLTEIVK